MNKTVEAGVAMNAAAHIALGLVARATDEQKRQMLFIDFFDANGVIHPTISALSLIIIRGSNVDLRKFRQSAFEKNLLCIDFL